MNELRERRWSDQATLEDIYYCYRLLLGHEVSSSWHLMTSSFMFTSMIGMLENI